jgi:hypothetical protein
MGIPFLSYEATTRGSINQKVIFRCLNSSREHFFFIPFAKNEFE